MYHWPVSTKYPFMVNTNTINWNLILCFNTLRPRQNGRRFPDNIFKYIFLNENAWISLKISLKFVPMFRMNNIPALVQKMAWRRPGDKPLSEPMMGNSLTHICVTRPQWVKHWYHCNQYQHSWLWQHSSQWWLVAWSLHWRHNGRDSVSNHQPHDCILNRLFRRRSKKTSQLRVTGVWGIHGGPVTSPHKWLVTRKMFPFDDVIMWNQNQWWPIVNWTLRNTL